MPMPYMPYMRRPTLEDLWLAVRAGEEPEARWCIENGVDVNEEVHLAAGGPATALSLAMKNGHLTLATCLLENGADPNGCLGPNSCLLWALWNSRYSEPQVSMVELLLKHNADPNQRNKYGHLPLNYVIRRDDQPDPNVNLGIVKLLLEAGAHPDACMDGNTTADEGGLTCLMQAAFNDHFPRVKMLLKHRADPVYPLKAFENQNIQLSPDMHWLLLLWPSMTPTAIAAVEGHVDELTELLHKGADPTEEIKFPGCEKNSTVVSLAECEVFCMRLCGKQPSDGILQTLKCSMSWSPANHYLFPPAFRFGVVYLRKALKRNQTVFAGFNEDILVLIFTFLPRNWNWVLRA